MPTVFTRIIDGEIPGTFVWRDHECVAFLSINPITPGHVLVVPRAEVDHWLDLDPALNRRLMTVSQTIGQALERAFSPPRIGLLVAGFEIPHVHLHVLPINGEHGPAPRPQRPERRPGRARDERRADPRGAPGAGRRRGLGLTKGPNPRAYSGAGTTTTGRVERCTT